MRIRLAVGIASVIVLTTAAAAWATFQPSLVYDPPKIVALDHPEHDSAENVTVRREGSAFTFASTPTPFQTNSPECEITTVVSCPRAGIERIVVFLGTLDDQADIDLNASAEEVTQVLKGQDGEDTLVGHEGIQRLAGGADDDILRGGPGPDILKGGNGTDTCDGGPGHDEFLSCEQAPVR
jgi:hypothetical protein